VATPSWQLRQAARYFWLGGLIAYPTEAVYGLGCNPLDKDAVQRLLKLKQRPVDKGLILIASDFDQLRPFIIEPSQEIMAPVFKSWPGPATWLLPAASMTPEWITGKHSTIAARITAHPLAAELCRACNSPLISTSANVTGCQPAKSPLMLRKQLYGQIDFILHGKTGSLKQPTPIQDALSGALIRA
jgi:L-threonylcarbamoyladenylate synthase